MQHDRVQRRLAAILFADVVGYSLLTGQDEAGTWRRLRSVLREVVHPNIEAHAGRVIRIRGDGVMAEFSSAVEAVQSAIAVQQAMAVKNTDVCDEHRIRLRIGIHVGDIMIVENADLHGDGVNVAARLEPLAEPGGVCISATVYDQVRKQLPYPFEDQGDHAVKNIADPVRIYLLRSTAVATLPNAAVPAMRNANWRWQAASVVVIAACGVAVWLGWSTSVPQGGTTTTRTVGAAMPTVPMGQPGRGREAPPLSIVVLPFRVAGGEQMDEEFADGITEDLTTDLSRIPGAFVIAPGTALGFRNNGTDVRQLGRELSVRYVLQGSMRRSEPLLRVTAQLVETGNAAQVWAERFEADIAQLAKLQGDITHRIAQALNVALMEAESQRISRELPGDPSAVELTTRGMALLNRPPTRDGIERAHQLFERALTLKPDHAPALKGLGQAMLVEWSSTWYAGSSEQHLKTMETVVDAALELRPDDAMATYLRGYVQKRLHKNLNEALAAFERAIALDPNLAVAHNYLGQIKVFLGRADEAADHTLKAIQLSPRDPQLAEWFYQMAVTSIHRQQYDEAVSWGRRAVEVNPNLRYPYRILAAALALAGQVDEAQAIGRELLRRYPAESIRAFRAREPWSAPAYRAGQEREIAGMRIAGIPE